MNVYGMRVTYYPPYCSFTYEYVAKPSKHYVFYTPNALQKSVTNIMKRAFPEINNNEPLTFRSVAVTDDNSTYFQVKKWKIFVNAGYVVRIKKL